MLSLIISSAEIIYSMQNPDILTLSPKITFLQKQPVVDGLLDNDLEDLLPQRKFDFKFNVNIFKGTAASNYRLAYGTGFIYLYLEAKADSFICRDRGYQNGDGFILTLSSTNSQSDKSDEHYVMGFSSQYNPQREWATKILWNYNGKVILSRLMDDVLFEYKANEGKIGFELVIPWSSVYPYHPLLSEGVGFNLWFMKAYPKRRLPNVQGVLFELPSETGSRRYIILEFEEPILETNCQSYMVLENNHCQPGEKLEFDAVVVSDHQQTEEFDISILNENKEMVGRKVFASEHQAGVSLDQFEFNTSDMIPGNYTIEWQGIKSKASGKLKLSVLPKFNYKSVIDRLENVKSTISEGSYTTMQFAIQEVNRKIKNLKDYEDSPDVLNDLLAILNNLEEMELGGDIISSRSGVFRRAFRSDLDSTLQPYTVQVPDNYDKSIKYPLLVFLHGSGRSDKDIFSIYHQYLSKGDFIQIAPFARGVSHYYGLEKAQFDIYEAIQNTIDNYPIDTSNIVLVGFSMGGYGVYRTFIESPYLFDGLAIFSGEPKVGILKRTRNGNYPNFIKKRNYTKLRDVPVFIYHGKNDLNCPYELTDKFVKKLISAGVNVEFAFDEAAGHSSPEDDRILTKYYEWLYKVIE